MRSLRVPLGMMEAGTGGRRSMERARVSGRELCLVVAATMGISLALGGTTSCNVYNDSLLGRATGGTPCVGPGCGGSGGSWVEGGGGPNLDGGQRDATLPDQSAEVGGGQGGNSGSLSDSGSNEAGNGGSETSVDGSANDGPGSEVGSGGNDGGGGSIVGTGGNPGLSDGGNGGSPGTGGTTTEAGTAGNGSGGIAGSTGGTAETGGTSLPEGGPVDALARVIDDMETFQDLPPFRIDTREGRSGYYFKWKDPSSQGSLTEERPLNDSPGRSTYKMRYWGGGLEGVGGLFGLDLLVDISGKTLPYDTTVATRQYGGLQFWARLGPSCTERGGSVACQTMFNVALPDEHTAREACGTATSCDNDWYTQVNLTDAWQCISLPWSKFSQTAWSDPAHPVLSVSALYKVTFRLAKPTQPFDYELDDIGFMPTSGLGCP